MKILLNGATGGTNFGDFIFAKMFNEVVSSIVGKENVFWYESRLCMSDFYKRHLNYQSQKYKLNEIDALICISGGYFCGDDRRLLDYVIRYFRYFHLCNKCIRKNIPIAIIGVEVARPKLKLMERIERYILKKAKLVVVRNDESYQQLAEYGIKGAMCTADTAHSLTSDMFEKCELPKEILMCSGKKIFFHVQQSIMDVAYKTLETVNLFLEKHPEYSVVFGRDQFVESDDDLVDLGKRVKNGKSFIFHYDDPMCLCKLLSTVDFIVTPKLHVGIVGATLSKSVVSFSHHTQKIERFYNQLEENGRSLPMDSFSNDVALSMMEKYHDKPINVPKEILSKAESNIEYLKRFIAETKEKKAYENNQNN